VGDGAWGIDLNEFLTCVRGKIGVTVAAFGLAGATVHSPGEPFRRGALSKPLRDFDRYRDLA